MRAAKIFAAATLGRLVRELRNGLKAENFQGQAKNFRELNGPFLSLIGAVAISLPNFSTG